MFGQYATFIIPSYLVSAVVILAMLIWIRSEYKARQNTIAELEKSGIRRRSG